MRLIFCASWSKVIGWKSKGTNIRVLVLLIWRQRLSESQGPCWSRIASFSTRETSWKHQSIPCKPGKQWESFVSLCFSSHICFFELSWSKFCFFCYRIAGKQTVSCHLQTSDCICDRKLADFSQQLSCPSKRTHFSCLVVLLDCCNMSLHSFYNFAYLSCDSCPLCQMYP